MLSHDQNFDKIVVLVNATNFLHHDKRKNAGNLFEKWKHILFPKNNRLQRSNYKRAKKHWHDQRIVIKWRFNHIKINNKCPKTKIKIFIILEQVWQIFTITTLTFWENSSKQLCYLFWERFVFPVKPDLFTERFGIDDA